MGQCSVCECSPCGELATDLRSSQQRREHKDLESSKRKVQGIGAGEEAQTHKNSTEGFTLVRRLEGG